MRTSEFHFLLAVFVGNLFLYFQPAFLSYSLHINALFFFIGLYVLKEDFYLLIPIYMYSPIQLHSGAPFFSMAIYASLMSYFLHKRNQFRFDLSLIAYALVMIAVFLSYLRAVDYGLAEYYLLPYYKAFGVLVFCLTVFGRRGQADLKMMIMFAVSSALCLLYKVLYLINREEITSYISLLDEDLYGKVNIFLDGDLVERLALAGQDPNYASILQMPGLVACLLLAGYVRPGFPRVLCWFGVVANFIQIIGSYSRSGFIFGVLIVLMAVKVSRGSLALAVFGVWGVIAVVASNESLAVRLLSVQSDVTGAHRTTLWADALNLWAPNPFFGNGFSNFYAKHGEAAHSTYLQILAEQGLLGLLSFLTLVFLVVGFHLRNGKPFGRVMLGGILGFCLMLQTLSFNQIDLLVLLLFMFRVFSFGKEAVRNESV